MTMSVKQGRPGSTGKKQNGVAEKISARKNGDVIKNRKKDEIYVY